MLVSCVALLPSQDMSDSESSNSDHFEDAVESVEIHQSPTSRAKRNAMKRSSAGNAATVELPPTDEVEMVVDGKPPGAFGVLTSPDIEDQIEILTGDQLSGRDQRWRRLENLRRKGEAEGEQESGQSTPLNTTTGTPPDSTESSVEGIYLSGVRSLHPFKVVESDTRSVQSESRSITRSSSGQHAAEGVAARNKMDIRPRDEAAEVPSQGGQLEPVLEVSTRQEASGPLLSVPDIVSSSKPVTGAAARYSPVPSTSTVMGPPTQPMAPPRRKKTNTSQGPSLEHSSSVESDGAGAVTKPLTLPLIVDSNTSKEY